MISIANNLNKERAVLNRPFFGPFECLSHLKHVVSLNTEARNSITPFVKLSVHGRTGNRSAHTV